MFPVIVRKYRRQSIHSQHAKEIKVLRYLQYSKTGIVIKTPGILRRNSQNGNSQNGNSARLPRIGAVVTYFRHKNSLQEMMFVDDVMRTYVSLGKMNIVLMIDFAQVVVVVFGGMEVSSSMRCDHLNLFEGILFR